MDYHRVLSSKKSKLWRRKKLKRRYRNFKASIMKKKFRALKTKKKLILNVKRKRRKKRSSKVEARVNKKHVILINQGLKIKYYQYVLI